METIQPPNLPTIKFNCPHCDELLETDPKTAGTKAQFKSRVNATAT